MISPDVFFTSTYTKPMDVLDIKKGLKYYLDGHYQFFERYRIHLYHRDDIPFDIKENITILIENILDYDNRLAGIIVKESEKFDKVFYDLYGTEYKICKDITRWLADIVYKMPMDEIDTIRLLLDVAIEYSMVLQSYVDKLDELVI